jgi:hypothetical protein
VAAKELFVIVRDDGATWSIVLQTDHADLSGQFARAWGNEDFSPPQPAATVARAAARHDDGWAIWERQPRLLAVDGQVKPRNFLDVQILSHLAFYRAQIAAVGDEDPYAGLLISMHGAGIYNGRYGTDPALKLTFAPLEQREVDGFVSEQEDRRRQLVEELSLSEDELWTNYRLLQIFDRLSLHFCMKNPAVGAAATLRPVPTRYAEEDTELAIEPDGPWRVKMDPYPFGEAPARFVLLQRDVPKGDWRSDDEFRNEFFAHPAEEKEIVISPS